MKSQRFNFDATAGADVELLGVQKIMANWFYVEQNQRRGPVDDAEFRRLIASKTILSETYVWCEGMSDWSPAHSVSGIEWPGVSALPPPLPPTPPPMDFVTSASTTTVVAEVTDHNRTESPTDVDLSPKPIDSDPISDFGVMLTEPVKVTNYIILSVFLLFSCLPVGILGIVFSLLALQAQSSGNFALAHRQAKRARMVLVITFWIGVLGFICLLIMMAADR